MSNFHTHPSFAILFEWRRGQLIYEARIERTKGKHARFFCCIPIPYHPKQWPRFLLHGRNWRPLPVSSDPPNASQFLTLTPGSSAASCFPGSRWIINSMSSSLAPRKVCGHNLARRNDLLLMASGAEPGSVVTLAAPSEAPSPRVGATTVGLKDTLYMFSGRGGLDMAPIEEKGALWRYSPSQSLWKLITPTDPTAPYPAGRSYHAMASDGQNTIYIHAGCPEKGRLSDLWSFNIETATWAELPAAPPPARGGTSIAICGRKLYRINGFDGTTEQGGAIDVFDLDRHTWSTITFKPDGSLGPEPRSVSALVAVKVEGTDFLLTLFGERDPSSLGHAGAGKMLADVWAFDLGREEWTKVAAGDGGDAPAPRGWFAVDAARDQSGKYAVIVHGGLAENNSRLGDIWSLQFE